MKIKRIKFDREIHLLDESPPGIDLPWGFNLIRFNAISYQLLPLVLMHVGELVAGESGEALCGERGTVGMDISYLVKGKTYPFCVECQQLAKALEEGGA
jgi:hypothetical protein